MSQKDCIFMKWVMRCKTSLNFLISQTMGSVFSIYIEKWFGMWESYEL